VTTSSATSETDGASHPRVRAFARDLVVLAKPRITGLVIFTFGGGLLLAPGTTDSYRALIALLGTTLIVAAANAINMYLERDVDGLMRRTRTRPLPEGRLAPFVALAVGALLASAAVPLMLVGGGFLMTGLGLVAFYIYVWGYTPLKRRSAASLYLGAIPGAMPPLMGWVAVTGRLDAPGLALFAIMFVWQIPHFAAIATFRAEEYAGAGFRVISLGRQPRLTRATIIVSSLLLLPVSLSLWFLDMAGALYAVVALILGMVFFFIALRVRHLSAGDAGTHSWAKALFFFSLLYLVVLFGVLGLDRTLRL
jgi:heme o synthase